MMGGGMMGGGMGFGMFFGWIFWLLILALVAYGIFWLVRQSGSQSQSPTNETPLAILKRRYAAGEIDQPQYEAMKSQLS